MAAYLAGAGLNGIIPARGGDIVKLWLVHRRIEGARYPTLAATFVPETSSRRCSASALVVWALARGFLPVPTSTGELPHVDVSLILAHPILSAVVVGRIGAAAVAGLPAAAPARARLRRALPPGPRDLRPPAALRRRRRRAGRRSGA